MAAPTGIYYRPSAPSTGTHRGPVFGWGFKRTPRPLPLERPAFSPVSDAFYAELEKARDALPQDIQTLLAKNDFVLKPCRRAQDIVNSREKAHTMAFCYSRGPKDIYIAEEYINPRNGRRRSVVSAQREDTSLPAGEPALGLVLKHETGHIIDRLLGNISEYPSYKECLKTDRERLAKNGVPDETFNYLCGSHNRKDTEVIAEILTELTMGAPSMLSAGHRKQLGTPLPMDEAFPETCRWVKARLQRSRFKHLIRSYAAPQV